MTDLNKIILIYIVLINLVTFIIYWIDKRRAIKDKWRIPEKTLIILAFIGGSVGALAGMMKLRHKTKHWKFKILVPLALILHIAIFVFTIVKM